MKTDLTKIASVYIGIVIMGIIFCSCSDSLPDQHERIKERLILSLNRIAEIFKSVANGKRESLSSKAPDIGAEFDKMNQLRKELVELQAQHDGYELNSEQKVRDGELIGRMESASKEMTAALMGLSAEQRAYLDEDPVLAVTFARSLRWNDVVYAEYLFVFQTQSMQIADQMVDAMIRSDPCEWISKYALLLEANTEISVSNDLANREAQELNSVYKNALGNPRRADIAANVILYVRKLSDARPTERGWITRIQKDCPESLNRVNAIRRSDGMQPLDH